MTPGRLPPRSRLPLPPYPPDLPNGSGRTGVRERPEGHHRRARTRARVSNAVSMTPRLPFNRKEIGNQWFKPVAVAGVARESRKLRLPVMHGEAWQFVSPPSLMAPSGVCAVAGNSKRAELQAPSHTLLRALRRAWRAVCGTAK